MKKSIIGFFQELYLVPCIPQFLEEFRLTIRGLRNVVFDSRYGHAVGKSSIKHDWSHKPVMTFPCDLDRVPALE